MKWLRNIILEDLIIILFVIASTLILLVAETYFIKNNEMDKLTNDFYGKGSIHFNLKKFNQKMPDLKEIIDLTKNNNYILFKKDIMANPNVKGVLTSGEIDIPPMESGRFFQKRDFYTNKKVAVIGKSVKELKFVNGKKYIGFQNELYEVIGIMGAEYRSKIDYLIFLNLDAVIESSLITGPYVIDGLENIEQKFNNFKQISEQGFIIERINVERKGLETFFDSKKSEYWLTFIFLLALLSSNILLLSFWIYKKRVLIGVQLLIGHDIVRIFTSLYKKYLILSISSIILGAILFVAININDYINYIHKYSQLIIVGLLSYCFFHFLLFLIYMKAYTTEKSLKVLK